MLAEFGCVMLRFLEKDSRAGLAREQFAVRRGG